MRSVSSRFLFPAFLLLSACASKEASPVKQPAQTAQNADSLTVKSGYAEVNGIKMYYELYGAGKPLVLIHGGGSTIQSTFGRIIPLLAKNHSLIAVELQNHGRSGMRNVPETFEQDADDVAALLKALGTGKADVLGFSNGGHTAMQMSIRHPETVNRLVVVSSPVKRSGFVPGFFEGMQHATIGNMPAGLKEAFLQVNPDTAAFRNMFNKDCGRMQNFKDWDDQQIRSIQAPTLLLCDDADVITPNHAAELFHLLPDCRLAILPGVHGQCLGEVTTLHDGKSDWLVTAQLIEEFLAGTIRGKK